MDFQRGRPLASTSVAQARRLRKQMTPEEVRVWGALRKLRAPGYHFRRQVPIDSYIVDFAALKHRLVVEIDGSQHGYAGGPERDQLRDAELARRGFRVLRFWNNEVCDDFRAVIDTIFAHVNGDA
ncbi:MAG: endonuclease domain-containing protein [Salinarimonas sp.]